MKSTDNRRLFGTLIGASAATGNIVTIPATQGTAGDGTASIALAFPPETFIARAAGGEPPRGADMNGFLNLLSSAVQVLQAGYLGPFDAAFAAGIGGYPAGAVVSGSTAGTFWVSTAEANTTVPGATGANWKSLFDGLAQLSGGNNLSGTQMVTNGDIISETFHGGTATGQLCWGGSAGGQILGRGTTGPNGPVGAYLYPIEVVGSYVGGRLQVQGYGQRADVDFRLLSSGATVMLFGGNQVAYLTDVTSAVSAEAKLRSNADTTLQTNINNEAARAKTAENTLQTNINNETERAEAAESALTSAKLNRGGDTTTGSYTAVNWAAVSVTTSTANGVVNNWGGYLTSRITGRDVTTSIFSWENVGQDQGATIQIAGYGLDVRYTFPKSGRMLSSAGTMAVTSDLPTSGTIAGGYYSKIGNILTQSFTISANNGTQISLPISFTNTTYTVNIAPSKAAVSSSSSSHTVGYVVDTKTSSGFVLTLQWQNSTGAGDETTRIPVDITVIGEAS
ncbi:hypothetical protein OQ496_12740 [Acetobacter suratthaniensis]|uniref:hypothetical protein n=1 Tax=Acetobacter suratthaniensis TaxID=1502841 RepID=UPI001FB042F7|nr:hypothetical protein [Acetobacter suratthaniensis]MCX2567319.1 hypothetical protein [Acetobacter suratthaniensis]